MPLEALGTPPTVGQRMQAGRSPADENCGWSNVQRPVRAQFAVGGYAGTQVPAP